MKEMEVKRDLFKQKYRSLEEARDKLLEYVKELEEEQRNNRLEIKVRVWPLASCVLCACAVVRVRCQESRSSAALDRVCFMIEQRQKQPGQCQRQARKQAVGEEARAVQGGDPGADGKAREDAEAKLAAPKRSHAPQREALLARGPVPTPHPVASTASLPPFG